MGQTIGDLKEGEEIIEPLSERVLGRVTVEDVIDPITNTKMVYCIYSLDC